MFCCSLCLFKSIVAEIELVLLLVLYLRLAGVVAIVAVVAAFVSGLAVELALNDLM